MKTLDIEDLDTLKSIVIEFSAIRSRLTDLEKQLEVIQTSQKSEIKLLESLRVIEQKFLTNLELKYGPGKLDPQTLNWISYDHTTMDKEKL